MGIAYQGPAKGLHIGPAFAHPGLALAAAVFRRSDNATWDFSTSAWVPQPTPPAKYVPLFEGSPGVYGGGIDPTKFGANFPDDTYTYAVYDAAGGPVPIGVGQSTLRNGDDKAGVTLAGTFTLS
jgi:hypothetical protein